MATIKMKALHWWMVVIFLFAVTSFNKPFQQKASVIFDTDMGPDYDDVGAIAMLHALADSNQVNILATIASTRYEGVASVLDILNTYFNRPTIPIGIPASNGVDMRDRQHWSDTLRKNYPHTIRSNKHVPEAVELYRRLLSREPDSSVTIITVGFLTNLNSLLLSKPDHFSRLNGTELVKQKVKKLVSMAGRFPSGKEFNIHIDAASARYVFDNWPAPVVLSGFEIGEKIKSGIPLIQNESIKKSPVKDVFRISIPLDKNDSTGRMSWDQTAVLVAVKGHEPYYRLQTGTMTIDEKGNNTWVDTGTKHSILIQNRPPSETAEYINKLMQHQPVKRKKN